MNSRIVVVLIAAIMMLVACEQRSPYQKMVDKGLKSGERYDSLFMDIHFGMTTREFFDYCFELNQKGVFLQGNASVKYHMKDGLPFPATMEFYPVFQDTQIVELPMALSYDSWAPWNKNTFADSLQVDLKNLLEEWHGEGFMEVTHPERGSVFVKVDGNRRIIIAKQDDKTAKVLYTDMSVERTEETSPKLIKKTPEAVVETTE